jgi:hypothetical protein
MPSCHKTIEVHDKRHREVAALIQSIQSLDRLDTNAHLLKDRDRKNRRPDPDEGSQERETDWNDESVTLNEDEMEERIVHCHSDARKAAKAERRTAKNQSRVKVITQEDLDNVQDCLHPEASKKQADHWMKNGQGLANNKIIEENIAFRKSNSMYTSFRRAVYERKLAKASDPQRQPGMTIEEEKDILNPIMVSLGLNTNPIKPTRERKSLYNKLRTAIMEDLIAVDNEQAETMQRMAGYWRYANRRTYNQMVKNNELWDWATGQKLPEVEDLACIEEEKDEGSDSALNPQNVSSIESYDDDYDQEALTKFARDRMNRTLIAKLTSSLNSPTNSPERTSGSSATSLSADDDSYDSFWTYHDPSLNASTNLINNNFLTTHRKALTPKPPTTHPSPFSGLPDHRSPSNSNARIIHSASPPPPLSDSQHQRPLRPFIPPGTTILPHATDLGNRYGYLEHDTPAPSEERRPSSSPRKFGVLSIRGLPEKGDQGVEEGWLVKGGKHKQFPLLVGNKGKGEKRVAGGNGGKGMDFARAARAGERGGE